jgi:hypothetical protein
METQKTTEILTTLRKNLPKKEEVKVKEIFKHYIGKFKCRLGIPHIIITCQELKNVYRCEQYIFLRKTANVKKSHCLTKEFLRKMYV